MSCRHFHFRFFCRSSNSEQISRGFSLARLVRVICAALLGLASGAGARHGQHLGLCARSLRGRRSRRERDCADERTAVDADRAKRRAGLLQFRRVAFRPLLPGTIRDKVSPRPVVARMGRLPAPAFSLLEIVTSSSAYISAKAE